MKKYTIGLDLGSSSVKAVLFDGEKVVANASAQFYYKDSMLKEGVSYIGFDADEFYATIVGVIKELAEKSPQPIYGLAFASASGNTLLLDEKNKPLLDAYSWMNKAYPEEVSQILGDFDKEYIRQTCGWGFSNIMPLSHLSHIKVHAPELLKKAKKVCMTTEYVLYKLTGKWGIDRSTATPFFLADQESGTWHKPYLGAIGICESQLMPIGETGDFLGTIRKEVIAETGLSENTKVFLGSFDHPSGARANGVDEEGALLLSCGTSWVGFFPYHDRQTILENRMLCDPFLQLQKGLWGAMFSLACISMKIEYFIDKYIDNSKDKFAIFNALAAKAKAGAGGLSIDLYQDTERDLSEYSKENICMALMESPAKLLKEKLEVLQTKGITFHKAYMAGGPSKSPIWHKVVERIIGLPITITYGVDSGAVGAALLAQKE